MTISWLKRWAPPLLLLAGVIGLWELWVAVRDTPDWYLPPPSDVMRTLWEERSSIAANARVTLEAILLGLLVACVFGVLMALAIDASRLVERTAYPLVIASQAIPVVALAPLFLIWFGHGLMPRVVMTALIAFFPITVATTDGLRSADSEVVELLRSMGASRWQRLRLVRLPSALPAFFSGLKVAVSVAVIGAVIGEFIGSDAGLGHAIVLANASLRTDLVFACVFVLSLMAIALFGLASLAERLAMPWRRYQVEERRE